MTAITKHSPLTLTNTLRFGQRGSSWATAASWIALFIALVFAQSAQAWSDDCKQASSGNQGNDIWQAGQGDSVKRMTRSVNIQAAGQWITPGLALVTDTWADRVLCFSSKEQRAIVLKIVPTAAYLDALKENGLDLKIASTQRKPSEDLMLLRDNVVAGVGKTVSLQGFTTMKWNGSVNIKLSLSQLENDVPWIVLDMSFVVTGPGPTASSKRTLTTPHPSGLSIKIMPAGYEAGALVITPLNSSSYTFLQCPTPAIHVNGSNATETNIDFGPVSLDRLTRGETSAFTRSFSVQVVSPANSGDCSVSNRTPKMRFVAAGKYQHDMFEGDVDLNRYPGNSSVAIQVQRGSELVKGSNRGDPYSSTYITLDQATASQSFTATVRRKQDGEDRAGPFLVPINLEAYYY